jgi:hypothetical protein
MCVKTEGSMGRCPPSISAGRKGFLKLKHERETDIVFDRSLNPPPWILVTALTVLK